MNTPQPLPAASPAPWIALAETRTGRTHLAAGRPNEDAVQVRNHAAGGLTLALADGVGSGRRGDLASAAVVQHWTEAAVVPDSASALGAAQTLLRGSEAALRRVLPPALGTGGSMLVVAWTWADGQLVIGHVGDCRAYRWRAGELKALTRDHTYANLGLTPPAWRLPEHPARMVGNGMMGPADVQRLQLQPGDVILLCSDGVHGALGDADLLAAWSAWAKLKPQGIDTARRGLRALALRLLRCARLAGGRDDVSVVLAAYQALADAGGSGPPKACAAARLPADATLDFADSAWPDTLLPDRLPVMPVTASPDPSL